MSELKPCPFCGEMPKVNTWTMHGITESRCFCDNEKCPVYLSKTTAIDDWNNRPIEDALQKRAERAEATVEKLIEANEDAQSRLDDYRQDYATVVNDQCPTDERHCGCVPVLRRENRLISEELANAKDALNARIAELDILQDRYDALEKDYADVCQKRLEAADVFSRQIIELESRIAELEAENERLSQLLHDEMSQLEIATDLGNKRWTALNKIYNDAVSAGKVSVDVKISTDNNKRSKWKAYVPGWGAPTPNKRYLVKLINDWITIATYYLRVGGGYWKDDRGQELADGVVSLWKGLEE